jgi:hypothetical protein
MLFQQIKPTHHLIGPKQMPDFGSRVGIRNAPIPDAAKEALIGSSTTKEKPGRQTPVVDSGTDVDDDPVLRVFDEL